MYYNYVYLDPRKKGKFVYEDICFLFEPFYVGKGKGNRFKYHLKTNRFDNPIFKNKLNKLKDNGYTPFIILLNHTDVETDSYINETNLITCIGSNFINQIKDGPLLNICLNNKPPSLKGKTYEDIYGENAEIQRKKRHLHQLSVGGYFKGKKHKKESKIKISESLKGNKNPMWGKNHTQQTKEKIGNSNKGKLVGNKNPMSRKFIILSPNKECFLVHGNFQKFCDEMCISASTLKNTLKSNKKVSRGKTKGWIMYEYNSQNISLFENIQPY